MLGLERPAGSRSPSLGYWAGEQSGFLCAAVGPGCVWHVSHLSVAVTNPSDNQLKMRKGLFGLTVLEVLVRDWQKLLTSWQLRRDQKRPGPQYLLQGHTPPKPRDFPLGSASSSHCPSQQRPGLGIKPLAHGPVEDHPNHSVGSPRPGLFAMGDPHCPPPALLGPEALPLRKSSLLFSP